jgi:hypothetical protein
MLYAAVAGRLNGVQGVPGSNPGVPTKSPFIFKELARPDLRVFRGAGTFPALSLASDDDALLGSKSNVRARR